MSARNGNECRFDQERKQTIARPTRAHELLERAAMAGKSAGTTVSAQPRSVSA